MILLGTEEQVRLAAQAAQDMVAGRRVETAALVASLRAFIRQALDLAPIPAGVVIPGQGPLRVAGGKREGGEGRGGGGGGGGSGMGGGMAAGAGAGIGLGRSAGGEENTAAPPT